jgi:hypothetical protein
VVECTFSDLCNFESAWPPTAARQIRADGLSGCPGDERCDDVGGVPVQARPRAVVANGGPRIGVGGGLLHIPQRHPGVKRGGDEGVPQRVRADVLGDPGRRVTRRTIRAAPCRSSRRPSPARNSGPSARSPAASSIARAVRGASGMVTTLPPLRVMTRVRCPRSRPRCSMSAPVASDTRSPLSASSEMRACSTGGPSPAATRMAPSSLRSRAVACDS